MNLDGLDMYGQDLDGQDLDGLALDGPDVNVLASEKLGWTGWIWMDRLFPDSLDSHWMDWFDLGLAGRTGYGWKD